jgi:hypothetical protein
MPTIVSVAAQVSLLLKNMPDRQAVEQEIKAGVADLSYEQVQALLAHKRKSSEA